MDDRIYILSVRELLDGLVEEPYIEEARQLLDENRQRKVDAARQKSAKCFGLGAGLLLQYALCQMLPYELCECETGSVSEDKGFAVGKNMRWEQVTFTQILKGLQANGEEQAKKISLSASKPEFRYGPHGKPYLTNYPYYFNLSHSGEYVVCALSTQEIGIDIQKHKDDDVMKLAERFFSDREREVLRKCPKEQQRQHFFDLWARKEAYGKMTGEGVVETLNLDLEEGLQDVIFEEYHQIPGYSVVVCKSGDRALELGQ